MFTSTTRRPVIRSTACLTLRWMLRPRSAMGTPYSTTMSRSIAASVSPTSTPTPWEKLGPALPGMRSRMEPKARVPPVPIACTPAISRHALPAIFCTTPSATDICPSSVASRSLVAGAALVLVVTGICSLVPDPGWLIWNAPLHTGRMCDEARPGQLPSLAVRKVRHRAEQIVAIFLPRPAGAPAQHGGDNRTAMQPKPRAEVGDSYLVARAREGYLDAYEMLVQRHSAMTYRVALRLCGNHHDAQDIAQEALIAAWRNLDRFRADSSFSTWLYQIVTRQALNKVSR